MKRAIFITILLLLSAVLIPAKVQTASPEEKIVLSITNPLNYTRTDEPVIIRWVNLTDPNVGGLPQDANPDSFRVNDKDENEIPSQFDDLSAYGYDKYLVFAATVPSNSTANYTLSYTTGSSAKPEYTPTVNVTDAGTAYSFAAQNYSGIISKTSGVMISLKTSHSGELLNQSTIQRGSGFCDSQVYGSGGKGWSVADAQMNITDAQTTLLAEGPVRSIIVTKGAVGTSGWNFTTIYLMYKDRVETLTHHEYLGEGGAFRAVRVSTVGSLTSCLEEATVSLDGAGGEVSRKTVNIEYGSGYTDPYHEWPGGIFTVRAKTYYEQNGEIIAKWFDITSKNGSFGYGFIVHNAQDAVRIEVQDGRAETTPDQCIYSIFYQASDPADGDTLVIPDTEYWYHWAILPHDDADYNYTKTEAEKAYNPLGFKGSPATPPPPPPPVWLIYAIFFAITAAIAILFARKLRART